MEFISHCFKRDPRKLEYRATFGMLIMLVVLSLLGWIYLTQASHVATTSRRIQELQAEKAELERRNMELMIQITELESVSRLDKRARELGFVPVPLDQADFVAVAEPRLGPGQEMDRTAEEDQAVQQANLGWRAPGAADEDLASRHWIDGVRSQFIAWVQSETK
jgi:cell division protein FtsB